MTRSIRIADFDTWQPGYSAATVTVYLAGTTTLASIYENPDLTGSLINPQTLASRTDGAGVTYGKWAQPVYVGASFELAITTGERTGVVRIPLFDLDGADASPAVVTPAGATEARTLEDIAADEIRIEGWGEISGSAAGNATILAAAIAYAASLGGGTVWLPATTIDFTTLSVPQGVLLRGAGRGATILRSTQATRVITLAGDRTGLADLTLDGVSLATGSVGIYAVGRTEPTLLDVEIKRFEQGLLMKGATRPNFFNLFISNCETGADLRGDTDAGFTGTGSALRTLSWRGGKVDLCSVAGVLLSYENALAEGLLLEDVDFDTNSGTALALNGARFLRLEGGRFSGNTVNMSVADDSDTSHVTDNTISSVHVRQTRFSGGQITFDGTCEDVAFDGCDFADVDFVLSIPTRPVLLIDCQEDSATSATGATEKLQRSSHSERGTFSGVTTDGNYITAWSLVPDPGETVHVQVIGIGRQRNGVNYTTRQVTGTAVRDAATLGFDLASGTITVGSIVSGATSGASARIVANSQTGAAGTLSVRDVLGIFEVGDSLSTSTGETAKCTAPLNTPSTAVSGVSTIGTAVESDSAWDVTIDASSPQVRARVRGATSQTVEWTVQISLLRP
jgi:hypothetical protein